MILPWSELGIFRRINGLGPVWLRGRLSAERFARYATGAKLENYALNWFEKKSGIAKLASMPVAYTIDSANLCDLNCAHCLTGRKELKRTQGIMKLDLWMSVLDQISPYAFTVDLFNWGEPLLNPFLWEMAEYAHNANVGVRIATNLNRLDQKDLDGLFRAKPDEIMVSLDGPTKEINSSYRKGSSLNSTIENILRITERKHKERRGLPIISIRFLISSYSEAAFPRMKELAESLNVDCFYAAPIKMRSKDGAAAGDWLPREKGFSLYNEKANTEFDPGIVHRCPSPWEQVVIAPDGGICPCCWFDLPEYDCGDAGTKTIREIWNAEKFIAARQFLAGNTLAADNICRKCRGRPLEFY